jgi:hypothetical protein
VDELTKKARLAEIPRLIELESRETTKIAEQIEKLERARKEGMQRVYDLQSEEIAILREMRDAG